MIAEHLERNLSKKSKQKSGSTSSSYKNDPRRARVDDRREVQNPKRRLENDFVIDERTPKRKPGGSRLAESGEASEQVFESGGTNITFSGIPPRVAGSKRPQNEIQTDEEALLPGEGGKRRKTNERSQTSSRQHGDVQQVGAEFWTTNILTLFSRLLRSRVGGRAQSIVP